MKAPPGVAGRGVVFTVSRGRSVCRGDLGDGGPGGGVVDEVLSGAGGGDQGCGADVVDGAGLAAGDLVDLGVANNLVEKSGSWFSYKGERIGQGRENAKQFLKDNADIRQTIDTELRKLLGLIKTEPAPPEAVAAAKPLPAVSARGR